MAHPTAYPHRIRKWRTRGKKLVPCHESKALEDKQKLQMKTFSEVAECLARISPKITLYGLLFKYNYVGCLLLRVMFRRIKKAEEQNHCKEALYNNCFICNLSTYWAFDFKIVSIRSRIKLALCLNWRILIPNSSRRGRIQNRDNLSQNLVNTRNRFRKKSTSKSAMFYQFCYWSPGHRRPNKRSPGFRRI